jgi:hypothetical protein
MPQIRRAPSRDAWALVLLAAVLGFGCSGTLRIHGQVLPSHVLAPSAEAFRVPPDVAVLHYYGAGGWGISWRGTYLLAAPYFSNHRLIGLPFGRIRADLGAIRDGFAGTPARDTAAILVGHGHLDHAGDIAGYFESGAVAGKPTPIHSDHAPHLQLFGLHLALYGGIVRKPRTTPPTRADHFRAGYTWAFLIDLLDDKGAVALRIHYMDAAGSPPHGLLLGDGLRRQRDVDVHIACVPGYDFVDDYPEVVLRHHRVRYVLGGHWENFFRSRKRPLEPVPLVLSNRKMNDFVDRIERVLGREPRGVSPLNKEPGRCPPGRCGARGPTWAVPVPGETYQFRAGPQPPAPALPEPRD